MLSQAEWKNDSRVIREAESLVAAGHEVHVVARKPADTEVAVEELNGVVYHSIPHVHNESSADVRALVTLDVRVRGAAARRILRGPKRIAALSATLEIGAVALAAAVLVPAIMAAQRWPRLRERIDARWQRSALRQRVLATMQPLRYLNDFGHRTSWLLEELNSDVIHAHDLITLSAAATVGKRRGAKVIYDAHELETHTNYHSLSGLTKQWIARYEGTLIHECDGVVTVCDSIADWLRREYRIPRPIVVMNAPSGTQRTTAYPGVRAHLDLSESTPLAVYVGSVTLDRGLELTVEALSHLPDVHLATVGWRYPVTEAGILRTAAAHGVSDRVHLVDPVASSEVIGFIRSADVSVIPIQNVCLSYYYCFPNKLLESVFAGLPVVAANLAELVRFVERHRVGVVMDERDPRSIAKALREALHRRDELRPTEKQITGIERIYGWRVQEERLLSLYASLDGGRRRLLRAKPQPVAAS